MLLSVKVKRIETIIYRYLDFFLEEGTGTHSSILAWRNSWTGEPGGLPSQGRTKLDMTEVI